MQEEIWKDCAGYEGLYEISNLGRVRNSISKSVKKTWINRCGNDRNYIMVDLHVGGCIREAKVVKRLVVKTFYGALDDKALVIHKDGNFENCSVDNLIVIDRSSYYRSKDMFPNSYYFNKGIKVRCVETGTVYYSVRQCALDLGVAWLTIAKCAKGGIPQLKNGLHVEFVVD